MPFDGNGGFSNVAGNPVVTGTTISSTTQNNTTSDYATGFETCLTIDGQTVPTANIPMGGFRITGLGNGTVVTDAARVSQVQNQAFSILSSVAGTNTITGTATPTPAAIVTGQLFRGIAAGSNSGAATINISSLGPYPVRFGGAALTGGEIMINQPFEVMADTSASCMHLTVSRVKYPTQQRFTSGSGTYTTPAGCRYIRVRMVGGGGGGSGRDANNGITGGDTTFSTLTASGGVGGTQGGGGGAGGAAAGGDINIPGGAGTAAIVNSSASVTTGSAAGGNSAFGGGGAGSNNSTGGHAAANSGGGGGGAGGTSAQSNGASGGAGGYVEKLITAPSATYSYAVGGAGAGGAAGGIAGGNGAAGIIIVDEFYS